MASDSTERKTYRQEAGKVITVVDMQAHTLLAYDLDAEDNWALLSADDGIIGGLAITHSSGNDFDVSAGVAIDGGEILKNTSPVTLTLDSNPDPSNTRVDLIVVDSYSGTTTDNSTDKVLSSVSINTETGTNIGTGDGVTKTFDLGNSKVILRTLEVFLDGNPSSDWVFVPEGGTGTQDAVWFATAPGVGVAVTTNHKNVVGGEEYTPGVPYKTRFQYNANVTVVKGTPGSPPALPAGNILLGSVTLPALWAGGSSGVTIFNTTKHFIANTDSANDEENSPFSRPARISDAIRSMGQVRHGCRLRYVSSDTIAVGPGWVNHSGLSMRVKSDITLQLQASNAANPGYVGGGANSWVYVYAVPPILSGGGRPGDPFSLDVSFSPPNSLGHCTESPLPFAGFYLGAVYLTSIGPVTIRPFYRVGDWVYWEAPSSVSAIDAAASGTKNIDLSAWCPPTGRLVDIDVIDFTWDASNASSTPPYNLLYQLQSHKAASGKDFPRIRYNDSVAVAATCRYQGRRGVLHAEYDSGVFIHSDWGYDQHPTPNMTVSCLVCGYIEDIGHSDTSGTPTQFY